MMSLQSKLKAVRDALVSVQTKAGAAVPCYHYYRAKGPVTGYIVWAEDSEADSANGDNRKTEQQIHGTVDYYTQTEFDPVVDGIQDVLNTAGIGFRLNSVQYEDETKLIHWEWEFYVG